MLRWSTTTDTISFTPHHHHHALNNLTYIHRPIQFPCKESLVSAANFRDPVSSTHPPHQSLWFAWRASWWDGIYKDPVPISSSPAAHPSNPGAVPSLLHRIASPVSSHPTRDGVIVCDVLHRLARSVYNNSHSLLRHRRLPCHWHSIRSHTIWSNIPCGPPHQKIRFTLTNFGLSKMMRKKLLECNRVSTE
jgi:hypothetical protein